MRILNKYKNGILILPTTPSVQRNTTRMTACSCLVQTKQGLIYNDANILIDSWYGMMDLDFDGNGEKFKLSGGGGKQINGENESFSVNESFPECR